LAVYVLGEQSGGFGFYVWRRSRLPGGAKMIYITTLAPEESLGYLVIEKNIGDFFVGCSMSGYWKEEIISKIIKGKGIWVDDNTFYPIGSITKIKIISE